MQAVSRKQAPRLATKVTCGLAETRQAKIPSANSAKQDGQPRQREGGAKAKAGAMRGPSSRHDRIQPVRALMVPGTC